MLTSNKIPNRPALLARLAGVTLAAGLLAGCVYYPSGYAGGYGGYGGGGYYAAPAYVAPPVGVVIGLGGGWHDHGDGGGWHDHGGWR